MICNEFVSRYIRSISRIVWVFICSFPYLFFTGLNYILFVPISPYSYILVLSGPNRLQLVQMEPKEYILF